MNLKIKKDTSYSNKLKKALATVEIVENTMASYSTDTILVSNFLNALVELLKEYRECVDSFSLSLLDDIEAKWIEYEFYTV